MRCPYCNSDNDAHTAMTEAPEPYAGAVSLCAYCCRFNVFDTDNGKLILRKPTEDEQRELDNDSDAQQVLKFAQWMLFKAATTN